MKLRQIEKEMLDGLHGKATQKAMQILIALGKIFNADHFLPVASVQVAGVSYDNLGEAGLSYLTELVEGGGKVRVLTTLNPAGMDIENWHALGISEEFAINQQRVIEAFAEMGIITTCTCTPYLVGNLPVFGQHLAWSESSAVCYANSIIGARTNREGGPSALASALTGVTPAYGYHLLENRKPSITVNVNASLNNTSDYGALGHAVSSMLEKDQTRHIPYFRGIERSDLEQLKSLCASIATYAGAALFHIENLTPETERFQVPREQIEITDKDISISIDTLNEPDESVDFVTLGCPHLSIREVKRVSEMLSGKKVKKEFWITTSRPVKEMAERMGYAAVIEASGAIIAADTCCVVAPIKGRFYCMATDSAKACFYAYAKNTFKTRFLPFEDVVREALS